MVILTTAVEPLLGCVLFRASFTVAGVTLGVRIACCCLVVIGLTPALALIALRRHALLAIAWVAGFGAVLAVLVPSGGDVFVRAELAFVVGGIVAVDCMAISAAIGLRGVRLGAVSCVSAMERLA